MKHADLIRKAAEFIYKADAIYITAGAGFGVDSGLPDFRGDEGFYKAYPPMEKLGLSFIDCANPDWFYADPSFAWGFYGHRLGLYRETVPHEGFHILRRLCEMKKYGGFVFTSNVDGQFQKAGFGKDQVYECHGSIHYMQCSASCTQSLQMFKDGIWSADDFIPEVDPETFQMEEEKLPKCPACKSHISRPNILMFGDWHWNHERCSEQNKNLQIWFQELNKKDARVAVIELGAGQTVPTVRMESENVAKRKGGSLTRINVRESEINPYRVENGISLPLGALEALEAINDEIKVLNMK